MVTEIIEKSLGFGKQTVKNIAAGKSQAALGIQSPDLAPAIVRIGRFLYVTSAGWIAVSWYSGYVNKRTAPGSGPQLVLPGKPIIGTASRSDKSPPSIGGGGGGGGGGGAGLTGPVRQKIVQIARAQVGRSGFDYQQVRPYPSSFNIRPWRGDCSSFVITCYKLAGAPDPSGNGYNGQGWTGDLEPNGQRVSKPNIGDLAFWSNPDHVAVVVGTGNDPQIVEFGAPPSPVVATIGTENRFHQAFLGYRTYGGLGPNDPSKQRRKPAPNPQAGSRQPSTAILTPRNIPGIGAIPGAVRSPTH